jgi:uncharacterized membrane protein
MTTYEIVKTVHILGTVLLFGTGIGTAFFLFMAYCSGDIDAIRVTTRHVVVADWLFTAPVVVAQPVSGVILMQLLDRPFDTVWFAAVSTLFVIAGLCWVPVVFIQYRLRDIARNAGSQQPLPPSFRRLMRIWIALGIPAFAAVFAIVVLMVTRAGTGARL